MLHVSDKDIDSHLKTHRHHKRSEHTPNIGSLSSVLTDLTLMRKLCHSDRISVSLVP